MRRRKEQIHLDASEPNQNPRGAHSSLPGSSDPVFGDSSGDPSRSTRDNPTKDTSPVTITKTSSLPIENQTKDTYHVSKELKISKPIKMLMKYPNGYPTGVSSTMPYYKPSSNPRSQPSSDPDVLKRGI